MAQYAMFIVNCRRSRIHLRTGERTRTCLLFSRPCLTSSRQTAIRVIICQTMPHRNNEPEIRQITYSQQEERRNMQ